MNEFNFLKNYRIFSSGNEAPELLHIWSGLSVLSAAIGRRVSLDQGIIQLYPNLYVVLVGDPGNGKSVAMQLGKRMVREIEDIPIAPSSITREATTQMLGDDNGPCNKVFKNSKGKLESFCQLALFANELVTLLGAEPIRMIQFLTDIWDEDRFEVKTKNAGNDYIERPYLSLLGCMTPETTGSLLKDQIISGGFARRCIWVFVQDRGDPVPRPVITPEQIKARDFCIAWGKQLQNVSGEFTWTKEAEEYFDKWYTGKHYDMSHEPNLIIKGYLRTKDCLLLKVGMLLSLSESFDLILEKRHLEFGLALLGMIEPGLLKVFQGTGRNQQAGVASQIINYINNARVPIPLKQIQLAFFNQATSEEITQILAHLRSTDQIDYVQINKDNVTVTCVINPHIKEEIQSRQRKTSILVDLTGVTLDHESA